MKHKPIKLRQLTQSISLVLIASTAAQSAEFIVTTNGDDGGGVPNEISTGVFEVNTLRSAIEQVNDEISFPGADSIRFAEDLVDNEPINITLTNSELLISSAVNIEGPGAGLLTLSGNDASRIIRLDDQTSNDINVTISDLTLSGGNGISNVDDRRGGCILNRETLTVNRAVIEDCSVEGAGGAIWSFGGGLNLNDSLIQSNKADNKGGGLYFRGGEFEVNRTTITGNTTAQNGGGVYLGNGTQITFNNSTIANNLARDGDGFFCSGGLIKLINSTVFQNAEEGLSGCGNTEIINTVIAGHSSFDCDITGNNVSVINSLDSDGSCEVNASNHMTVADPMLEPLANFGGLTHTLRPLPGSSVIDAGDDFLCLEFDQRGEVRPQDGDDDGSSVCDIGAVELSTNEPIPQIVIYKDGFDTNPTP